MNGRLRVAMLLGAGTSLPSGAPRTADLTQSVLSCEWKRHTDGRYYPGADTNPISGVSHYPVPVRLLARRVAADVAASMDNGWPGTANYEHVYYVGRQIADHEGGEILNPAIEPYVEALRRETSRWDLRIPIYERNLTLRELADELCLLIECAVWERLAVQREPIGLGLIAELARAEWVVGLDVATLNHDLLIESSLRAAGVEFADGFGARDGDVVRYDPQALAAVGHPRLYKLHGSVDWLRVRREQGRWKEDAFVRVDLPLARPLRAGDDAPLFHLDAAAVLAIGTYNKIPAYDIGILGEMHTRFFSALDESEALIVSGYSWGDRGINTRLYEWLHARRTRRLLVLHRDPEALFRGVRSWLSRDRARLEREGRLRAHPAWLQDVSEAEVRRLLLAPPPGAVAAS